MKNLIITDNYELWKYLFSENGDIIGFPYNGFKKGSISFFIYKITHSKKIGRPFLAQWNNYVINKWEKKNNSKIILFLNPAIWSWYMHEDFLKQLKKRNVKLVLLMLDSMSTMRKEFSNKILYMSSYFEIIYTFDFNDAKKYNWIYTQMYYSKLSNIKPIGSKYDVLCICYAGNRIKKLIQIWDILKSKGINCFFAISGLSNEEIKNNYREGIIYNHYFSYGEIISRVQHTNVILEITQSNQSGYTLRTFESVCYNKKLLTNNPLIYKFKFYEDKFMKCFSNIEDLYKLDLEFFCKDECIDYHYNDEFSPKKLFRDINLRLIKNKKEKCKD
ncbi:hypothetical protein [Thomasclavelia cocleata]|uniref:hypothetical protein n=1 Tax=Thomasclavelia cocleata TaxID=69824 RepID=UPI002729F737|nr:hypothetical protein [Thomasclavelia cocleata]